MENGGEAERIRSGRCGEAATGGTEDGGGQCADSDNPVQWSYAPAGRRASGRVRVEKLPKEQKKQSLSLFVATASEVEPTIDEYHEFQVSFVLCCQTMLDWTVRLVSF